ncbi:MAG: hypothetical protein OXE95_02490 [Chloroflexi bacterium]|nr:hypothetical protein [Chloroflexota bacterium]
MDNKCHVGSLSPYNVVSPDTNGLHCNWHDGDTIKVENWDGWAAVRIQLWRGNALLDEVTASTTLFDV